jgi:hypothetical protein
MIGKKITFSLYDEKGQKHEDSGIIMDKVRNSDYIKNPDGTDRMYVHDLYVVQTESTVLTLHPSHITKID